MITRTSHKRLLLLLLFIFFSVPSERALPSASAASCGTVHAVSSSSSAVPVAVTEVGRGWHETGRRRGVDGQRQKCDLDRIAATAAATVVHAVVERRYGRRHWRRRRTSSPRRVVQMVRRRALFVCARPGTSRRRLQRDATGQQSRAAVAHVFRPLGGYSPPSPRVDRTHETRRRYHY